MEEYFRVCFMFFVAYLVQMMLVILSLGDKLSYFIIQFWLFHAIVIYPVNCWCIYILLRAIQMERRRVTSLIDQSDNNLYGQPLRIRMLDSSTMTLVNYKKRRQESFTALNMMRRMSNRIRPDHNKGSITPRRDEFATCAIDSQFNSVNTMKETL